MLHHLIVSRTLEEGWQEKAAKVLSLIARRRSQAKLDIVAVAPIWQLYPKGPTSCGFWGQGLIEKSDNQDWNIGQRLFDTTHSDRARAVLEIVPAAMVVIDEQGLIQAFSKSAESIFGYMEDNVIGENVSMLMAEPHRHRHDAYLKRYRQTGERRIIGAKRVENARHRDGHLFPIELSITEVYFEDIRCFVGFLNPLAQGQEDPRQANSLLAELAHSSRISAMGALATAIAHELNQPLTSIANYSSAVRDLLSKRTDIDGVEEYVRALDACNAQAIRAGQLIHRLREFVKGGPPQSAPTKVDELIDKSISLALINGFKRNVIIDRNIAEDLPFAVVDRLQGQQVLFNLIRNAFEAMDAEHTGNHRLRISAQPDGNGFVEISVEDSGTGIDPELRESIFQGFVTTKSSGMGVGLAISRQIVEANGGRIWVGSSDVLGGAKFTFTLPQAGPQVGEDD